MSTFGGTSTASGDISEVVVSLIGAASAANTDMELKTNKNMTLTIDTILFFTIHFLLYFENKIIRFHYLYVICRLVIKFNNRYAKISQYFIYCLVNINYQCRTPCYSFGFLSHFFGLVSIPLKEEIKVPQLFQQTTYHQPRQALRLGMLDISHHHDLSNIVCDEKERLDHFQPHNNLPAQSLPFVSALLLPVLHLSLALPLQHQGLGTRRLLRPYLGGFPTIFYQLTKASQNFFRSLGEISYADLPLAPFCYHFFLPLFCIRHISRHGVLE
jgi:hypothetical protein